MYKRNKVLIISIFGVAISIFLIFFGSIFKSKLELSTMSSINDFVKLFAMSVKGTVVCKYCALAFLGSTAVSVCAKFMKY